MWLAPMSASVDWCEKNYIVSDSIAEFTNTISSLPLLVIPSVCFLTNAWESYTRLVCSGVCFQMCIMTVIGLSSMYVHATLSLLGQLFDEVGIVWALFFGYAGLMPKQHRPRYFTGNSAYWISTFVSVSLTCAWFVFPYLNGFVLMALSLPIVWMHSIELVKYKNPSTLHITRVTLVLLIFAIFSWVVDIFFCKYCEFVYIPGMHNLWHITVSFGAYLTITLFAYRKTVTDAPDIKPTIRYMLGWGCGLPYVYCEKKETLLSPGSELSDVTVII